MGRAPLLTSRRAALHRAANKRYYKRFTPRKTRRGYKVAFNDPDLFRRRARRPVSRPVLDKLVKGIRLTRYRPTVKVTTRTPKQASDYQRHRQWATRQKKHNKIDYYNVPLDRDTQYLLGITDADRQNKKAVGEAIGEVIGEMMMVLLDLQLQLGLTDKKNDKLAINKVRLAVRGKRYPHRGSIIPESGDIIER